MRDIVRYRVAVDWRAMVIKASTLAALPTISIVKGYQGHNKIAQRCGDEVLLLKANEAVLVSELKPREGKVRVT